MAIKKVKQLIEDLQNNTTHVVGTVTKDVAYATTAGYAGTASVAATGTSGSAL